MAGCRLSLLILLILATCFVYAKKQEPAPNPCGVSKLPCNDLQCIGLEKWCDKKQDCKDASDEAYCKERGYFSGLFSSSPNKCLPEKHFECEDGRCVPLAAKCDGFKSCYDGSDEDDCTTAESSEEDDSSTTTTFIDSSEIDTTTEEDNFEAGLPYLTTDRTVKVSTISAPALSSPKTLRTSVIPEIFTRTAQIPLFTSTVDYRETRRTYQTPSTSGSYHETAQGPRRPYSHDVEQSYYDKEIAKLGEKVVYVYQPSRNRVSNRRQTPNNERLPYSSRADIPPSIIPPTNIPVPHHLVEIPIPHTNGQRAQYHPVTHTSQYSEQRNVHRTTSLPASPRPETDAFPSARQLPNRHGSHIVQLHRRSFHSPRQHPTTARGYPPAANKPKTVLPPFYFQHNYTKSFGDKYTAEVRLAEQWILEQRDDSYEWGEDTPRALIALSLINNSFLCNNSDNDLMKRKLETHLGIKLLKLRRNETVMSDNRLAIYINALLATCQDPKQFLDQDVAKLLLDRKNGGNITSHTGINPTMYLSLCLTNSTIDERDVQMLNYLLNMDARSEYLRDRQILAITALACIQQLDKYKHNYELKAKLEESFQKLVQRKLPDGSFGSKYSTALAAQALMSVNSSWDARSTMDYLAEQQLPDGSFGDMLATYYILPALSGRSLLHLRNTQCDEIPEPTVSAQDLLHAPGTRTNIFYTLKVENPAKFTVSIPLSIPKGTSFFDAMEMAALLNSQFRFLSEDDNRGVDVHTISDIPNDIERGYRWLLYVIEGSSAEDVWVNLKSQMNTEDIHKLIPRENDEFIFWYLRI